jgi:hypothetical protein
MQPFSNVFRRQQLVHLRTSRRMPSTPLSLIRVTSSDTPDARTATHPPPSHADHLSPPPLALPRFTAQIRHRPSARIAPLPAATDPAPTPLGHLWWVGGVGTGEGSPGPCSCGSARTGSPGSNPQRRGCDGRAPRLLRHAARASDHRQGRLRPGQRLSPQPQRRAQRALKRNDSDDFGCGSRSQHVRPWPHRNQPIGVRWPS